uniref:Uncharacterized protein n=1 Tax=Lotharella globosa TaxID=91324 RepID=A0A7S4DQA8_9EUKA
MYIYNLRLCHVCLYNLDQAKWDSASIRVGMLQRLTGLLDFDEDWHVWRMDWDSQWICLYVDGHVLNKIRVEAMENPVVGMPWQNGAPKNPFRASHFLILNLAIGLFLRFLKAVGNNRIKEFMHDVLANSLSFPFPS